MSKYKIGLIWPGVGTDVKLPFALEWDKIGPANEFRKKVPHDVSIFDTQVPMEEVTPEGLLKMLRYIDDAAAHLAHRDVDIIVFACTSGSFINGIGYDKKIIDRISKNTGIHATTTTTAIIDSLKILDVSKIFVATPYVDSVNQIEKAFLENSGFTVFIRGLELEPTYLIPTVRSQDMYKFIEETYESDAESIFVSCTCLNVMDIIEPLEKKLKRPVITSNSATLWATLRALGVTTILRELGTLFKK